MPVYGDLRTMSLTEILRWAGVNRKTGVLEVERNTLSRRVEFRKGWVGSCSSNDPASLLGQFLLSRGKITAKQLQHALTLQRSTQKRLGLLLVELGVLTRSELTHEVAAKAEETIQGLYDWADGMFRYHEGATLDPDQIEVNLVVDALIEKGEARREELHRIREAFESSGVVLVRTELDVSPQLLNRPLTRRMFDSIDGQRTLAEVLLRSNASEFRVLRFLHTLYRRGMVKIVEIRDLVPDTPTLLDPCRSIADPRNSPCVGDRRGGERVESRLEVEIDAASQLMQRKEFEAAVELLRATCREHADEYARRLLSQAEEGFLATIREDGLLGSKVPVLVQDLRERGRDLPPEQSYLLNVIDGKSDIQSIVWLTPLRELDCLRTLHRLLDAGIVRLEEPSSAAGMRTGHA